jgi:hypothetical protein
MIFLCHYKIDVHKKRLHFLTYENLDYLTGLILQQARLRVPVAHSLSAVVLHEYPRYPTTPRHRRRALRCQAHHSPAAQTGVVR